MQAIFARSHATASSEAKVNLTVKKRGRPAGAQPNSAPNSKAAKTTRDRLHSGVAKQVVELLREQNASMADILTSTAGGRAFPELSVLQCDLPQIKLVMANVDNTLKSVESHNKKALHGSLLRGVSIGTIEKYFTSVQHRYAANSKIPSYVGSPNFKKAGLFTEKYASGVKRNKLHDGEIDGQLHWCTTVEFTQHSGDTTEKYYRTDSKVLLLTRPLHRSSQSPFPLANRSILTRPFQPARCQDAVYYEHYRGAGFKMIMKTFAAGYSHLVDGKKLGDPKLRR
jgi:hypothetical protein